MKWVNHIVIGGSLSIAFNPVMLPVAVLGSTAPDWLEGIIKKFGYPIAHRAETHYLILWVSLCLFSLLVADIYNIIFWFALGGLSHVLADSLTVMGVPFGWWNTKRFHLFGGRLKTGESGEYFVSGGVAFLALVIGYGSGNFTEEKFFPFFYQWHNLYQDGVIDGHEWKTNRFKFI